MRSAVDGLFGIDDINQHPYQEINGKLLTTNPDTWYHHVLMEMARDVVAKALTAMVTEGYYTEEEAIAIAEMILHDNAMELFRIKESNGHYYVEN